MKRLIALAVFVVALVGFADVSHGTLIYEAFLDGPSEDPPNASPGTGYALVKLDLAANTLSIHVEFTDLIGTTTAAHIHAPTADPFTGVVGVATQLPSFLDFPIGVTSGTYEHVFDTTLASTFNAAFLAANGGTPAGAEAGLAAALADGKAYFNLHTNVFPGGEIRGFFTPTAPIPEPSTLSLAIIGGLSLAWATRRSRRSPA